MKENFKKIETTFGQIRVFRENKPETQENVTQDKFQNIQESKPEKIPNENENDKEDTNFFGIETKEDNFFDKQLVNDYKALNKSSLDKQEIQNSLSNEPTSFDKDVKSVNYFDEQLVEQYKINKQNESSLNFELENQLEPKNTEKLNKKELNFIDGEFFEGLTYSNDDQSKNDYLIGSIQNFKKKKSKGQNSPETIPIVKSKNISEESSENPKMNQKLNSENRNTPNFESQHKILQSEIPNWSFMTVDEATNILKSHICYHNEEHGILAIDKPYGLPSIKGPGIHLSVAKLLPTLEKSLRLNYRLLMCNRLDENTTGVMLFATNSESARKIRDYFDQKKVIKQYLAITKNVPKSPTGEINIPLIRREINGIVKTYLSPNFNEESQIILDKPRKDSDIRKNAISKYRILDSNNNSSLLEIQPMTGFQHQIRAHLSYGLGCPILGDHKYSHHIKMAPQKLPDEMLKCLKIKQSKVRYIPMNLHSYRIILPEFFKSDNIFITAKLPIHFLKNLKRLKLKF